MRARFPSLDKLPNPWGFVTEFSTLGSSLLTFIVVGERLGPVQFGALAAVLATVALLGPLVTAAPEHVVVQRIAQGVSVTVAWQRVIAVLLIVGPVAAIAAVGVARIVSPLLSVQSVLLITLGEVTFLGIARSAIRTHEAADDSDAGARVALVNLLSRMVALAAFALINVLTVEAWAVAHIAGAVLAAVHAHWSLRAHTEIIPRIGLPTLDDYRLGVPFALTAGPDGLLSNNDQIVLSASGLTADAGIYAAAYRIASIAGLPMHSILRTRYPSFFRPENQSAEPSVANVRSVLRATVPAGAVSGLGLFLLAPVTVWVLGDDFAESVDALRLLAFLPLVRSFSTPAANVLTGTGRQRLRILGTMGAAILNLILNLLLVPSFGWPAAVVTTLIAEVALCLWVWSQVFLSHGSTVEAGHD